MANVALVEMVGLMRIAKAVLTSRTVPDWPSEVIDDSVPLGKEYRVDLDSEGYATLYNEEHPEWGQRRILAIADIDDNGFPLPVCCLRIES